MIIRDNLTRFSVDLQMSKMPKLIGPELQCPQVYYFLQKGSELSPTNSRRAVRRPHT